MKILLRNLVVCFLLLNALPSFGYDLVVAKDGSGDYKTIREAIQAAPTGLSAPFRIFIKNGTYREKDTIPSNKPFIQFIGESVAKTIISWDDYSGKPLPGGGGTYGTSNSATLVVNATDFSMVNMTVENTTGDAPQALAINVNADRASFLNCRFLGGQDTVLTNGDGKKNFFKNCYIDGVVDFIFGGNRAVFDSCIIYAKTRKDNSSGSYITAANTSQAEPYGMVFRDCYLPANQGITRYVLGRPWQNATGSTERYNKTVFLNATYGANIIQPAGWSTWDAGTITSQITYAEYKSKNTDNSPADISSRVAWSKQLTDPEAAVYSNANLFAGWDPCSVFTQPCNAPRDIAVSNFQLKRVAATSQLTWNISWPMTGIKYELYRSSDNVAFTEVNEQTSVNDTSINFAYTDGIPAPGTSFYFYLVASKAGLVTHITDTILVSSVPTITVTGTPGAFLQGLGTPSNVQVYTVAGTNLSNGIIITPPNGFEISSNGGTSWNNSGSPVTLTPVAGNVVTTNISVRLNAMAAGPYSGNITHTSTGAAQVDLALTGTVQAAPLAVSETLIHWPFNTDNLDSAAVRNPALEGTVPVFGTLVLSDGVTVPAIPAFSTKFGKAFAPHENGSWGAAFGGNGSVLSRAIYDQFTIAAKASHLVRVDSLIITAAFYNTSSGTRFAVLYSKSGFVNDSAEVTGGVGPGGALAPTANGMWATPVILGNQTNGPTNTYGFALNSTAGIQLQAGETLTIRLYYACGSTSAGRYATVKNVMARGMTEAVLPLKLVSFDAAPKQSGILTTWKVGYEVAISYYEVERSADGMNFAGIGRVEAINSLRPLDYSFTDSKPLPGISYYRLKATEQDGKNIYSRSVKVNVAPDGAAVLYPNPAGNSFSVTIPPALQKGHYLVVNAAGLALQAGNIQTGVRLHAFKVHALPAGVYWLMLDLDGKKQTIRFMKD
jgi:pectin methylesterase-like acyl-CoA thioesterase